MNNIYKYGVMSLMAAAMVACNDTDVIPDVSPAQCAAKIEMTLPDEVMKYVYVDETGVEVLPLIKGETAKLEYTIYPEDITYKDVVWSSSQPQIASVSGGVVSAINGGGVGYSIISVVPTGMYESSGVSGTLKVKVDNELKPATGLTLNYEAESVYEGESIEFSATVLPENSTYRTVEWKSADESIATVDIHGKVTGVKVPSGTEAKVVITATTLDGTKISKSKEITVQRTVDPESVTIDQTYAVASGYACSIGEKKVELNYTTYPADCTMSQIKWSSSDPSIATVADGVVYFNAAGNFGDFTITATCPNGQSSEIKMTLAAGLIRELFNNPDNIQFMCDRNNGGKTELKDGYALCTTRKQNDTNQRGDLQNVNTIYLHPGNYPIMAWKMEDVQEMYPECTFRAFKFDTSGPVVSGEVSPVGGEGGGSDTYIHKYKCEDGSNVFIYDFTQQSIRAAKLDQNNVTAFNNISIKYADMRPFSAPITYKTYWVQTFKSMDELHAYLEKTGVKYDKVK